MREEAFEEICAHTLCGCRVPPGDDYCSLACEKAREETDCSCGHIECRAKA
jgi:hypothetical protein